jgi:hypothetical protein
MTNLHQASCRLIWSADSRPCLSEWPVQLRLESGNKKAPKGAKVKIHEDPATPGLGSDQSVDSVIDVVIGDVSGIS